MKYDELTTVPIDFTNFNKNNPDFPFQFYTKTEEKQMTKLDLKTGMKVVIENGTEYYVAKDIDGFDYLVSNRCFDCLENYKDDLKSTYKHQLDIVEIWKSKNPNYLAPDIAWKRIWSREDAKEITMDEVESKFGCKVKIVNKI